MAQPAVEVQARDAERTRRELLDVATEVFAQDGFAGARVDEIARRTRTTKRMIYYYFQSKEGLYTAVLERAYLGIRQAEQALDVGDLEPQEALRRLAALTFDHHVAHEAFIRLVSIENIHHGEFVRRLESLRNTSAPARDLLAQILERGRVQGVFREDADALDVHMLISAFCVFQVANKHTFGHLFEVDLAEPGRAARSRKILGDVVVGWLTSR